MKYITWSFLLYLISILSLVNSSPQKDDSKTRKGNKKHIDNIFEYVETKVLGFPTTPFKSIDKTLMRSLVIDYPEYKMPIDRGTFDLNDFSNIYQSYDDKYIRKLLRAQSGSNDAEATYIEDKPRCEESQERCIYNDAVYFLNKVNSTTGDKFIALRLLEDVENKVPESLFLLGVLYENYDIFFDHPSTEYDKFERNLKSLMYFKQCAEQGDSNCQLVMAHKHFVGEDVDKDVTKANILQYSVIKKEIKDAEKTSRFPWSMNDNTRNVWNHNYYSFLHDPDYKHLEYVEQGSEQKLIKQDSRISLANVNTNEFLADNDLINTMVVLKNLHKMRVTGNKKSQDVGTKFNLNMFFGSEKQDIMDFYLLDKVEYITDEVVKFCYSDLVNSFNDNMFSSVKDYKYVFELSKKMVLYYIENQKEVERSLSKVSRLYLKEIIIIFANVYKEHGIYDKHDLDILDLVFSLYKKAHRESAKSSASWEAFKFLGYVRPDLDIPEVFNDCLVKYVPEGYSRSAVTVYSLQGGIEEMYTGARFDEAVRTNVDLHRVLQSGKSSIPLIYESIRLGFMVSTKSQTPNQAAASSKMRGLLNKMQLKCNIDIFKQNFVNVMNYQLKNDQELNLFAMAQLASMGFVSAIDNLANELIPPIKIINDFKDLSPARVNVGISKYMKSYNFGDLNQGLRLSEILEKYEMYSEMLSLNNLIAEADGTFYSFYNIAKIYEYGYGVDQDYDIAADYYRKAFDVQSIQFFQNSHTSIDGLEVSINILLWKLKFKKIIDHIGLSMIADKVLHMVLDFTYKINGKLSSLDSYKINHMNIMMSMKNFYNENELLSSILMSIVVGALGYFLPSILRYLARTFNWTIEINGVLVMGGQVIEGEVHL